MMKRLIILLGCISVLRADTQASSALKLVRTIPLPGVEGRIDHMSADLPGHRLFIAALGNDSVEVIDVVAGKRLRAIGDCSEPQGLAFVPAENRLVIANGGSGVVKILDAASFNVLHAIENLPDADNVRYDAKTDLSYVGYGDGALGVINPRTGKLVTSIKLAGHPESFQLEQNGKRIFVNVPDARQIAIIDRENQNVIATWPMEEFRSNFPMALDEANHRLFIGCRSPARLLVLDSNNGKGVAALEIPADADDVFYDAARKQIYLSGGEGYVDVISQKSADTYTELEKIRTAGGARTSLFIPEQSVLCVAVPHRGDQPAEIRVFKVEP